MKKGWIVYYEKDLIKNEGFARYMVTCAQEVGMELDIIKREDMVLGMGHDEFYISGQKVEMPDYVINRCRDMRMAEHLEMLGIKVFNNANVTRIANDKFRTHQFVERLGIQAMPTYLIEEELLAYWKGIEALGMTFPVVVKTLNGHGGEEVFLACSNGELDDKAHQLFKKGHKELIIQACCNQTGRDVRVFVVGEQIIGAIKRTSDTDFRSNYSLGGSVRWYELSDREKEKVYTIARALESDCVGIDFILDQDNQFIFNEVEDAVGCRSLYQESDVDLARIYIEHIYSLICSSP